MKALNLQLWSRTLSYQFLLVLVCISAIGCTSAHQGDQLKHFEKETGLRPIPSTRSEGIYLGKQHRGYDVLFTTQMGNVWGRFAARIALGEVLSFVSDGRYRVPVAGSQLDRLLSRAIGQPVTIIVIAKHKKPEASRLDIITPFSTVGSEDPQPKAFYIGLNTGSIYSADRAFAARVKEDDVLMGKISDLWSPYLRVDDRAVTYIYSGPETDLSSMIREHGSYTNLINSIVDVVTLLADKI